jgi:hypothetical protein
MPDYGNLLCLALAPKNALINLLSFYDLVHWNCANFRRTEYPYNKYTLLVPLCITSIQQMQH